MLTIRYFHNFKVSLTQHLLNSKGIYNFILANPSRPHLNQIFTMTIISNETNSYHTQSKQMYEKNRASLMTFCII